MKTVLATICVLFAALAAAVEPGRHRKIPCEGAPYTYGLYVPASYAEATERKFPCLSLSSPTSNPGTFDLHRWAEEHDVLQGPTAKNEPRPGTRPATGDERQASWRSAHTNPGSAKHYSFPPRPPSRGCAVPPSSSVRIQVPSTNSMRSRWSRIQRRASTKSRAGQDGKSSSSRSIAWR